MYCSTNFPSNWLRLLNRALSNMMFLLTLKNPSNFLNTPVYFFLFFVCSTGGFEHVFSIFSKAIEKRADLPYFRLSRKARSNPILPFPPLPLVRAFKVWAATNGYALSVYRCLHIIRVSQNSGVFGYDTHTTTIQLNTR